MKFALDDDAVLRLSAVSTALFAAHSYGAPSDFQASDCIAILGPKYAPKFYYTVTAPKGDVSTRWFGASLGFTAAATMSVAVSDDIYSAKKNALKTAGGCWAVGAAQTLYNAEQGYEKKDIAYATVAGQAVMSALCLWRGFSDEE